MESTPSTPTSRTELFNSITADDWKRSLAARRLETNTAWEQIQHALRTQPLPDAGK
jgi:hypothetical protein